MQNAYLNYVATSVPVNDVHQQFSAFAPSLLKEQRRASLFRRMSQMAQIDHRYSVLKANWQGDYLDDDHFYRRAHFPDTGMRMRMYQDHAFSLAKAAIDELIQKISLNKVTHLIVTSCTGFYAPGLDLEIVHHYGLKPETERTFIGFMGCYAALNGMKIARHIVRSEPAARVLMLNLELCTLHLQETDNIEELLSFLIFADGCAASLISAEPYGLRLDSFRSTVVPATQEQITWAIGNDGFDMVLSGKVPGTIAASLPSLKDRILGGQKAEDIAYWGIHPGGRTILDAVQRSFCLPDQSLSFSREILRAFGNMSSATIMFVMKDMLATVYEGPGCGMAFGPGVTVESMLFHKLAA